MHAEPVPHRQERVAEVDGILFVNDTAATTPAAVFAALDRFRDRPVVLIAGGSEKNVPLVELAQRIAGQAESVVLLEGAATPELERRLRAAGAAVSGPYPSMEAAVAAAAALARPGAVVLLSPGCASFGMFRDEFHRGEAFRAAVSGLATQTTGAAR
jgi:UDP-N-acetylmuramoylalanine--D-glutamate ligase